jgi:hypothetical protein
MFCHGHYHKKGHEVNKYRIMTARKVEKDSSSSIKGNPIGGDVILVIMHFEALQTDVIYHLS